MQGKSLINHSGYANDLFKRLVAITLVCVHFILLKLQSCHMTDGHIRLLLWIADHLSLNTSVKETLIL